MLSSLQPANRRSRMTQGAYPSKQRPGRWNRMRNNCAAAVFVSAMAADTGTAGGVYFVHCVTRTGSADGA